MDGLIYKYMCDIWSLFKSWGKNYYIITNKPYSGISQTKIKYQLYLYAIAMMGRGHWAGLTVHHFYSFQLCGL